MLQSVLDDAPAWILRSGTWLLESLLFTIESDLEIALAVLISVFACTTAARLPWSFLELRFMPSGHGNPDYEQQAHQARAVLTQHAREKAGNA